MTMRRCRTAKCGKEAFMTIEIINVCPICGTEHSLTVDSVCYEKWAHGAFVQDAFPDLNAVEREFVKTGTCPKCQRFIFGNGDSDRIFETGEEVRR